LEGSSEVSLSHTRAGALSWSDHEGKSSLDGCPPLLPNDMSIALWRWSDCEGGYGLNGCSQVSLTTMLAALWTWSEGEEKQGLTGCPSGVARRHNECTMDLMGSRTEVGFGRLFSRCLQPNTRCWLRLWNWSEVAAPSWV
jgi:hypothetical protein